MQEPTVAKLARSCIIICCLQVKPGLSAFSESPEKAAASVAELLSTAEKTIPAHLWQHTPLALKATAGLRLLPEEQADAILEAVSEVK